MTPLPLDFVEHLRQLGYHPRSDKHSNCLAEIIVRDLVTRCECIHRHAADGKIVYTLNHTIRAGTADWNVDLVVGPPGMPVSVGPDTVIAQGVPSRVWVAVELKSVMTEHRKAVKNRKRDLEAHHEHVHNVSRDAIAGGLLIVNAASEFKSPLRPDPTTHRKPKALVEHCIEELRSVSSRGGATGYGLEAKCALVVSVDNQPDSQGGFPSSCFADSKFGPRDGDPLHYDSFIGTICDIYCSRFGSR